MIDLSGVPKSERELFQKNEEMIRRLLDRQLAIQELKEDLPKTDRAGRNKLQKEYGKINRWLGDLYQAPETYADVNIEGVTDKQLGERIHSHTRKVMDQWALDTRKSGLGGSSIHHGDSTMQTLGAVRTAPTGMRRDIIQAVKDRGKELATGKRGLNFFDVTEATHPLYHPGEAGKVDYKNKLATIQMMEPGATLKERISAIEKSTKISTSASEAADMSIPALRRKRDFLNAIVAAGGQEVLDRFGDPFDRSVRTIEGIQALRPYLQKGLLITEKGGMRYNASFGFTNMQIFEDLLKNTVKKPLSAVAGAASAIQPEAVTAAIKGDIREAAKQTVMGAVGGAIVGEAVKEIAPAAMRLIPKAGKMVLAPLVKAAGPVGAAYTGLELIDAATKGMTGKGIFEPSDKPVTEEDLDFATL